MTDYNWDFFTKDVLGKPQELRKFQQSDMDASIVLGVFLELKYIIVSLLLIPVGLSFVFFCLPIYLFRYVVQIYFKNYRPEFGKILSTLSSVLATDDLYTNPASAITISVILDGELEPGVLAHAFAQTIINARNKEGDLCYPELKQYIELCLDFYFWKNVENFDIQNYISVYNQDNREFHESELPELMTNCVEKAFPKFQSPWNLIIVQNYKPSNDSTFGMKTAVLFRYHHALADGYSMLQLMHKLHEKPLVERNSPNLKRRSYLRISQYILLPMSVPYRLAKILFQSYDVNPWHLKSYTTKVTRALLPKIPLSYLKEIQQYYQVSSITTVIFAAFAGAIRRAMLERGVEVPDTMYCLSPMPVPGHPEDKLRNHASAYPIKLPLGTADPVDRLKAVDKYLIDLKSNPTKEAFFWMSSVLGGLFHWMIPPFIQNPWTTLSATSFPGFRSEFRMCGLKCLDMAFTSGFLPRNKAGIGMVSLAYNGHIRFGLGMENALLAQIPNPSVADILQGFGTELEVLHNLQAV